MLVQVPGDTSEGDSWMAGIDVTKSGGGDCELHTHVADLLLREREDRARDKSASSIGGVAIVK